MSCFNQQTHCWLKQLTSFDGSLDRSKPPLRLNRVDGVVEMPQVVLPTEGSSRRLDKHLVGASLGILLETKRMNVVALGRWGHVESRQIFF